MKGSYKNMFDIISFYVIIGLLMYFAFKYQIEILYYGLVAIIIIVMLKSDFGR